MRPSLGVLFALIITLARFAAAQAEAPAEPPGEPAEEPATAAASETMVRFLHAAPNVEVGDVALINGENEAKAIEQFAGISFGEMSDYVPIAPGDYVIAIDLAVVEGERAGGVAVPADALTTLAG